MLFVTHETDGGDGLSFRNDRRSAEPTFTAIRNILPLRRVPENGDTRDRTLARTRNRAGALAITFPSPEQQKSAQGNTHVINTPTTVQHPNSPRTPNPHLSITP